MSRKDAETIWISSSAMKKPTHMVAKAKIFARRRELAEGRGCRRLPRRRRQGQGPGGERAHLAFPSPRSSTATVTERPGRRRPSLAASPSSRMRTGTRCTILVKLPVAFSGGRMLNSAPVAGARLPTWPMKTSPGRTSALIRDRQSRLHPGELALLEIGVDPEPLGRHQRDELGAHRREGAAARAAVADDAVDGRAQLGIAEVELGGVAIGDGGGEIRLGLLLLGIDDVELALGRGHRGAGLLIGGRRLLVIGIGLLEALQRGVLPLDQAAVAVDIVFRPRDLGRGRRELGLGLGDHRLLQLAPGVEIGQGRLLPGDSCRRPRQRGLVVAVVELHQQIAGMDRLVVGDRHLGDEARDLRRDHRDVAADIGIVGAFDEAPDRPPVMAVPGRGDRRAGGPRRQGPDASGAGASWRQRGSRLRSRRARRWS